MPAIATPWAANGVFIREDFWPSAILYHGKYCNMARNVGNGELDMSMNRRGGKDWGEAGMND